MMHEDREILIQLYQKLLKASEEVFIEIAAYASNHEWSSESIQKGMCGIIQAAMEQRKLQVVA